MLSMGLQLKVLESGMHLNNFLSWKVDPRVALLVEKTCFRSFLHLKDKLLRQNWRFLTALVLKYDVESSCFSFTSGEEVFYLDIGLEDILYITGLPIDGKQVSGKEYKNSVEVIREHLNLEKSEASALLQIRNKKKTFMIDVNKLKGKFEKVPEDANESKIEAFAKAYLLYLLGQVILANSSRTIAPMYLPLLNLEGIDDYAWGAATLGILKCAMRNVVEGKSKMLEGFSLALMVFALERFPSFRGLVPKPTEFPLILGWMKKIKEKTTKSEPSVAEVISFFSQIKVDDIDWLPYCEPKRVVTLPAKHCSQLWIKYARVPCICFQHIAYYRADLCHRQLHLERKDKVKLKSITNVKLMSLSRHKDKDWRTYTNGYTKANMEWKNRNKYLVKKGVDVRQLLNYSDDDLAPDFDHYVVKQNRGKKRRAEENESECYAEEGQKKLLILDVNGILVHIKDQKVYKRPHCDEFLEFCLQKFDVAIWSSRTKNNLQMVVEMFRDLHTKLIFCWSQEECKNISRIEKPIFLKQLAKVWEKYTQYNATNTLLVDDSPYKAICNPANTGIFPLSYHCARFDDNSLGLGGDIQMYLDRLAMTNNVQEFVKKNPFGKLPITETHVEWNHYQDLLK